MNEHALAKADNDQNNNSEDPESSRLTLWLARLLKGRTDNNSLRDALEEYVEDSNGETDTPAASHEKILISNILKLRDLSAVDVMIPRADITAVALDAAQDDLLALLVEKQYSRLPVYKDTLDNIVGTIHIKDILAALAAHKTISIKELMRNVPIISPAMPVLDLLLMMKQQKRHMVMVVDEHGGIDGLVTIGDLIESIVGEIDDEYDHDDTPNLIKNKDGSVTADARLYIEDFEAEFGPVLSEDEREDIDTLGGLVFSIAGRVPARGEIITHKNGMVMEIIDADPRRVHRLLIRNIPEPVPDNDQ